MSGLWNNHWFFVSTQHHLWNNFIKLCAHYAPWYSFIMPVLSLCVMVWIDSLHTQCQGHHQGLMNERWKGVEVEQRRKREISFFSHPCDRLISLLHYQAWAAGTGFNSSPIYHWATTMVNLDYLLFRLPNPSITSTCLVQQPGNQISPKSWPEGFNTEAVVLRRGIVAYSIIYGHHGKKVWVPGKLKSWRVPQ